MVALVGSWPLKWLSTYTSQPHHCHNALTCLAAKTALHCSCSLLLPLSCLQFLSTKLPTYLYRACSSSGKLPLPLSMELFLVLKCILPLHFHLIHLLSWRGFFSCSLCIVAVLIIVHTTSRLQLAVLHLYFRCFLSFKRIPPPLQTSPEFQEDSISSSESFWVSKEFCNCSLRILKVSANSCGLCSWLETFFVLPLHVTASHTLWRFGCCYGHYLCSVYPVTLANHWLLFSSLGIRTRDRLIALGT